MSCPHKRFYRTGRFIKGVFGKENLPGKVKPARSFGDEAFCVDCAAHLIVHDPSLRYRKVVEELEAA